MSVNLPLGMVLRNNGEEWILEGSPSVADGVYNEVVVANGTISSLRNAELTEIVPAPCAPRPGSGDGGSGATVVLDPSESNTLSWTADGRLKSQVYVSNSSDIQVTGLGSSRSPFSFTLVSQDDNDNTFIVNGTPDILELDGSGSQSDPYIISHKRARSGEYSGFTFDAYGHLTSYTAPSGSTYITKVAQGAGIVVDTPAPGVAQVSLPSLNLTELKYRFGSQNVTVDPQGRVKDITAVQVAAAGTYDGFANEFTYDDYGLLIGVSPVARFADFAFRQIFQPARLTTTMNITPRLYGKLRVSYKGLLGDAIKEDPGGDEPVVYYEDGYYSLPTVCQLTIDNVSVPCYIQVLDKVFVSVEAIYTPPVDGTFIIGAQHSVSIVMLNSPQFNDIGIMDVDLCQ